MRRHTRPGLSLTEVLVAMFVMALGLMALLTLFPLGAMQIGQALKDDRTAQTAELADTWTRVWWKGEVAAYLKAGQPSPEPLAAALDDPNLVSRTATNRPGVTVNTYAAGNYSTPVNLAIRPRPAAPGDIGQRIQLAGADVSGDVLADPTGVTPTLPADNAIEQYRYARQSGGASVPSYPVLLDPLGFLARSLLVRGWTGKDSVGASGGVYGVAPASTPTLLPRRNTNATSGATAAQLAFKTCSLTDDLTYQPNGGAGQTISNPDTGAVPNQLSRQGRYNWAAVIQRPYSSQPDVAELTILVFDGRPPFLGVAGDEVVLMNDTANGVVFHQGVTPGSRSVSLNTPPRGADQPRLVRRGGWIAVANMDSPAVAGGVRGVTFHRVTGLTTLDDTTTPQYAGGPSIAVTPVALDIDPPIGTVGANPQVILFTGLSEVFNRAALLP